jgi:hypothetical protein
MALSPTQKMELMEKALIHDMDEIYTGDMPSPHKELTRQREALPEISEGDGGTYTGSGRTGHGGTVEHPWNAIPGIIRAADLIDALQWSQKYVLDHYVIQDCQRRLDRFIGEAFWTLSRATEKVLIELDI